MYSPKRNCAALVLISAFMYLWAFNIFPRSVRLFSCSSIGRPIAGIWLQELGMRPRRFISGNLCFKFSVQFLCSVKYSPALSAIRCSYILNEGCYSWWSSKKTPALLWKYVGEWWHKEQLCTLWGEPVIGEAQLVDEESIWWGGGGGREEHILVTRRAWWGRSAPPRAFLGWRARPSYEETIVSKEHILATRETMLGKKITNYSSLW